VIRIVFAVIASLGVLMALGAVLARNLVHAALFLVGFFFLVACTFVLLEAEFLAAIQVLVYIGAIAILLLFGIMLTRNIQGDETTGGHWAAKLPAAAATVALFLVMAVGITREAGRAGRPGWSTLRVRTPLATGADARTPRAAVVNDMTRSVGLEMMTRFAIPFEVAGLLLTAAVVGAIALAMSETGEDSPGQSGSTVATRAGAAGGNGHAAPAPADAIPSRASVT
jgi:NADH-quinone oxidoreductase subunit J